MVEPQQKSIDLSLKSVFLDVEQPFAACNACKKFLGKRKDLITGNSFIESLF